jgi:hypothetical protein
LFHALNGVSTGCSHPFLFLPHYRLSLRSKFYRHALKLFLFTPPFTQLNTPYPATAYLKGFLNTQDVESFHADLGIEVILQLFCRSGLTAIFNTKTDSPRSEHAERIYQLRNHYINTIDAVVSFLQGKNPNLAFQIAGRQFLPEAGRFSTLQDLNWAFGSMGLTDKAKYFATLYLEDIADYIKECVDENFGFSRYAERLGRCASTFDELHELLQHHETYVDRIMLQVLNEHLLREEPGLVCISVPFPGNLYSAFKSAQYIKKHFPHIHIAMGGGFPNTELRSLSDKRVFEYVDFITLDDGEAPVMHLIEYLQNKRDVHMLKRTFVLCGDEVVYQNGSLQGDYKQTQLGTPDYRDLWLDRYISAVEIINPMHKLWSDGRWNKLTMAHGCYWGKCTFCDISLDYIQRYEPATASLLCDHIETILAQTCEPSFHFVDEAAPPALMKALAIELIRRDLKISWWTNIRFEKSFTEDLCYLLKASGCIAVSGGLEVASDRLLKLIDKGVQVEGVAQVAHHFTKAGILVHAYLMYGFPTETMQETVDSLEVVRQMFEEDILKSGFWHQFAMTAHSPVGLHPERFKVTKVNSETGSFANNDIDFTDDSGLDAGKFSAGLKISLFNYMQGAGLDFNLQKWFDFKIPETSISKGYIHDILEMNAELTPRWTARVFWLHGLPELHFFTKSKKGNSWEMAEIVLQHPQEIIRFTLSKPQGLWLKSMMQQLNIHQENAVSMQLLKQDFENHLPDEDFELFWYNKVMKNLRGKGLIAV